MYTIRRCWNGAGKRSGTELKYGPSNHRDTEVENADISSTAANMRLASANTGPAGADTYWTGTESADTEQRIYTITRPADPVMSEREGFEIFFLENNFLCLKIAIAVALHSHSLVLY